MERRDVLRSRKAIKNAFIELSAHLDISKITVNKVIEKANVSRGTFYAHFMDIYDLKAQVEEDYLKECQEKLKDSDVDRLSQDSYPQVGSAVRFLFSHAETIRMQAESHSDSLLVSSFREALRQSIFQTLKPSKDPLQAQIQAACISSCIVDGSIEAILHNSNYLSDMDKTAKIISSIVSNI